MQLQIERKAQKLLEELAYLMTEDGIPTKIRVGDWMCFYLTDGTVAFYRSQENGNRLYFCWGPRSWDDKLLFGIEALRDRFLCGSLACEVAFQSGLQLERYRDDERTIGFRFQR